MKRAILLVMLAAASFGFTAIPTDAQNGPATVRVVHRYYRTELYFGLSIPGGGTVMDDKWENFLTETITARFPRGFTVLDARGQWMQQDDKVVKEPTKIVVFLYPASMRTTSQRKIEEIRRAYIKQFKQESVLRVDYPGAFNVKF